MRSSGPGNNKPNPENQAPDSQYELCGDDLEKLIQACGFEEEGKIPSEWVTSIYLMKPPNNDQFKTALANRIHALANKSGSVRFIVNTSTEGAADAHWGLMELSVENGQINKIHWVDSLRSNDEAKNTYLDKISEALNGIPSITAQACELSIEPVGEAAQCDSVSCGYFALMNLVVREADPGCNHPYPHRTYVKGSALDYIKTQFELLAKNEINAEVLTQNLRWKCDQVIKPKPPQASNPNPPPMPPAANHSFNTILDNEQFALVYEGNDKKKAIEMLQKGQRPVTDPLINMGSLRSGASPHTFTVSPDSTVYAYQFYHFGNKNDRQFTNAGVVIEKSHASDNHSVTSSLLFSKGTLQKFKGLKNELSRSVMEWAAEVMQQHLNALDDKLKLQPVKIELGRQPNQLPDACVKALLVYAKYKTISVTLPRDYLKFWNSLENNEATMATFEERWLKRHPDDTSHLTKRAPRQPGSISRLFGSTDHVSEESAPADPSHHLVR